MNDRLRERVDPLISRVRSTLTRLWARISENGGDDAPGMRDRLSESAQRFRSKFARRTPTNAITHIRTPLLVVMMAGTTVSTYEKVGQFGRLDALLSHHARFFRKVLLITSDSRSYTDRFEDPRVRHLKLPLPAKARGVSVFLSVLLRFRSLRRATSIEILDEESSPAAWLLQKISGARLSMSVGASWAPPRNLDLTSKRQFVTRAAVRRIDHVIQWPTELPNPVDTSGERIDLPQLIDADLFCPLTTTDPTRPRTVGVFVSAANVAGARVILGVAERLSRRRQGVQIRMFISGYDPATAAASLQSEATERDLSVEVVPVPRTEMLPDAIARLRMCVAFSDASSVKNLLRSMASGVPAVAIRADDTDEDDDIPEWTRFTLSSGQSEEEIAWNIETLFREPGVRLRMAREGRRFVAARHSLEALLTAEACHLMGPNLADGTDFMPEPEFDAAAEAEKLAQMLESVGVARTGSEDSQPGAAA